MRRIARHLQKWLSQLGLGGNQDDGLSSSSALHSAGRISEPVFRSNGPGRHRSKPIPFRFDPGRVVAYFQPQICCNSGRVTGFEALARLDDPERGLLSPAAFLHELEAGDYARLTEAMLRQSLQALKRWDRGGFSVDRVGLNIAPHELALPRMAENLLWELDRCDIAPSRLVIEVLESEDTGPETATIRANLARLGAAGCGLDLDDFGTGYATLDSLRALGVGRIKIDRCFVSGCDHRADQGRMLLAILALADHLGLETIAEGVENSEEHAFLAQLGCGAVQGYAVGRPMPIEQTECWLMQHRARQCELPEIRRA